MKSRRLMPVLLCLLSAVSSAQETKEDRDGLRVSNLSTVYVETETEGEITGKLMGLNDEAIVILVGDDERRFDMDDVQRVQRKGDSVKNGAVIGAVVGIAMGILSAGIADCVDDAGGVGGCGFGAKLGFVALSTGIYAGAGAGIDAMIPGRTTLYEAPSLGSALQGGGIRIGFTWTW